MLQGFNSGDGDVLLGENKLSSENDPLTTSDGNLHAGNLDLYEVRIRYFKAKHTHAAAFLG